MKRRPLYESRDGGSSIHVDLTPLLDVVFILLIFFIITSAFSQTAHVPVQLPSSSSASDASPPRPLLLSLDQDGQIADAAGHLIESKEEIAALLEQPGQAVLISAERSIDAQRLVDLISLCRAAGAGEVALQVEKRP